MDFEQSLISSPRQLQRRSPKGNDRFVRFEYRFDLAIEARAGREQRTQEDDSDARG